jgi:hypothetical protein
MEAKLVEVIERHLPYEIGMLVFTAELLETMQPGNLPDNENAVRNALIESFCIHARNLIDFLAGKRKGVRAKAVTNNYKAFVNGEIDKALTQKIEDQIVTLGRTSDPSEKINWRVRNILLRAIATELIAFRARLKPQYRHTPWKIEISDDGKVALSMWVLPPSPQ